jgi:hypothetical protein
VWNAITEEIMKAIALVLFLLALGAGCARHSGADPSASPAISDKAACLNAGGKWVPLFRRCDY